MKKLEEKIISSAQIFKGRFLKVNRDEVEAPDGKVYFREYIEHPGAAMMIPLLSNGNVIMVRQYRHSLKQVFLEFPAGKLDKGESSQKAAQRELLEETGYEAYNWKYLTKIHPVIGYSNEYIDLYLATDLLKKEANLDSGEFLEVVEVGTEELLSLVYNGSVSDVKTQIGIFWLDKILKKQWG